LVKPVKPLIIGGKETSSYGAGEAWYLLDQRLGLAAPVIELNRLEEIDFSAYTHLLLPDGDFAAVNEVQKENITRWVKGGGVLITINRAAVWAQKLCFQSEETACEPADETGEKPETLIPRAYGDFADDKAQHIIGGAIVASVIDLSHPLAFGYRRGELPLLRKGTTELLPGDNAYATPVRYTASPLLAGFIGPDRLEAIRGQAAVIAQKHDKGLVVYFANNPLFRGYWRGTERMYINALYFGQVVEATDLPEFPKPRPETQRD
jgi:hypothetical protein